MLNYRKHVCDNHFFLPFLSAVHVCLDHSGFTVVNHFSIDLYCFLQKLVRRTIALDKSKWNKKRKGEMAEVLTEAYMSSRHIRVLGQFQINKKIRPQPTH